MCKNRPQYPLWCPNRWSLISVFPFHDDETMLNSLTLIFLCLTLELTPGETHESHCLTSHFSLSFLHVSFHEFSTQFIIVVSKRWMFVFFNIFLPWILDARNSDRSLHGIVVIWAFFMSSMMAGTPSIPEAPRLHELRPMAYGDDWGSPMTVCL